MAACGALLNVACAESLKAGSPTPVSGGVRFTAVFAKARTVAVAGSFNHWSTSAHPLQRHGSDGLWATVVPLARGEHVFMYVVDGTQWISPPDAEDYVDDGFGTQNGVVVVR